jgi:hypothetical protein
VGVGVGAATGPLRLPDWAKTDVPKMRMRIKAALITTRGLFFVPGTLFSKAAKHQEQRTIF